MEMILLELTMKGLRGGGCPWANANAFPLLPLLHLLQCFLQPFPSLASRVHALLLSELERERESEWYTWVDEWESEASADRYPFLLVLTCGSHSLKWQTTHFPFSAAGLCSIGRSGKLTDYSIVSTFAELTKSLGGWSLVANALLLSSP